MVHCVTKLFQSDLKCTEEQPAASNRNIDTTNRGTANHLHGIVFDRNGKFHRVESKIVYNLDTHKNEHQMNGTSSTMSYRTNDRVTAKFLKEDDGEEEKKIT